jgi:L-aminopeptidase/D-esterase-like protein
MLRPLEGEFVLPHQPRPGPRNLITDVEGLTVGHATDELVRSGVTALLCPEAWTAAVDVRGGGPADARERHPAAGEQLFEGPCHLLFGRFGVRPGRGRRGVAAMSAAGDGLKLSPGTPAIPIVPGACLHDLANGGDKAWGLSPPYRELGMKAVAAAGEDFPLGSFGAGRGRWPGPARAAWVQPRSTWAAA